MNSRRLARLEALVDHLKIGRPADRRADDTREILALLARIAAVLPPDAPIPSASEIAAGLESIRRQLDQTLHELPVIED